MGSANIPNRNRERERHTERQRQRQRQRVRIYDLPMDDEDYQRKCWGKNKIKGDTRRRMKDECVMPSPLQNHVNTQEKERKKERTKERRRRRRRRDVSIFFCVCFLSHWRGGFCYVYRFWVFSFAEIAMDTPLRTFSFTLKWKFQTIPPQRNKKQINQTNCIVAFLLLLC